MYYIGISAYYHESSVFLTDNKGTDCFVKEESFSRIKGDKNFPQRCLKFLIKKFDLNNENIKSICFYEKPFKSWWEIFYYSIKNPLQNKDFLIHHLKNFNKGSIFFYTDINKLINISRSKIIYSSHHLSHCLYGLSVIKNVFYYVYKVYSKMTISYEIPKEYQKECEKRDQKEKKEEEKKNVSYYPY